MLDQKSSQLKKCLLGFVILQSNAFHPTYNERNLAQLLQKELNDLYVGIATIEGIDGGLHPAVDGRSLSEVK